MATNEEKSKAFIKSMFPGKPASCSVPTDYSYPTPLPLQGSISEAQVHCHLAKLSPHKATGTDRIPNVVLKECTDALIPYLVHIFRAMFRLQVYYGQWKEIVTCVLRKPGKPRYDIPKAYRPITLLNSLAKLATSIVVEELSYMVETHGLLPETHFRGRPGRTTTDSLHLLTDMVKAAWRRKKVVSVLFLDVEGAFPNAVTGQLLHNMRKRQVPTTYVTFVGNLLTGRKMRLKFNDYTLDWFNLDNGIGQGDPLSMLPYLFYNADLLDVARGLDEKSLGYVDDVAFMATVTSRNTLDHADSSRAVHVTTRTRHRLPMAPGHLGPAPCAWNLSPRSVALYGP